MTEFDDIPYMDRITHEFVKEILGCEPITSNIKNLDDFKVVCDERHNQQEGSESMEYDDFNYYSAPKRILSISDEGIFSFTFPATADQHERTMVFRPRNGMAVEDLIKYLDRELPYMYNEEPLSELEKDKIRGQCGNSR